MCVRACRDSITGPRHAFFFLSQPLHSVTVYVLPRYVPSAEEAADPKLYAANVRAAMLKHGKLLPSDATFVNKLEFYSLNGLTKSSDPVSKGAGAHDKAL